MIRTIPTDTPTGVAEQIDPLITRVLVPNSSPFTYTGTQTYLVGTDDLAVIDPGPVDASHLTALLAAIAGRPVTAILCTHTHRDHSPGALPLAKATGAPLVGCAALCREGPFDTSYVPDRVLADGETISGSGWTLEAVATPGHASNHLCYALHERQALFTGDHVMGWSSTVILPPDGDMATFMVSLAKLLERNDRIYYPAHGPEVTNPKRLVRSQLGHRKMREKQIVGLLQQAPQALPAMVSALYIGLDARLHDAAGRSVLAHLIDLRNRGLTAEKGELWYAVQ